MQTTLSADQARVNWRDTLDSAFKGDEIVIERYGKPLAVVVNYEDWQRVTDELTTLRLAVESRSIASKNDAGGSWASSTAMRERMAEHGVMVG